jgi:hypothetical protein
MEDIPPNKNIHPNLCSAGPINFCAIIMEKLGVKNIFMENKYA